MIRWRILRALLTKEALRHTTNRGGLALAGLLVAASLLLATLNPASDDETPSSFVSGIHHCIIRFDSDSDWLGHLKNNVPTNLKSRVYFRSINPPADRPLNLDDHIHYDVGTGGIEVRTISNSNTGHRYRVWVRYPDRDRAGMTVFESWFWRETQRYFYQQASDELRQAGADVDQKFPPPVLNDELWAERAAYERLLDRYVAIADGSRNTKLPRMELVERSIAGGSLDLRAAIATSLVMFSLCFTCIYLMPSLTCEERERGLLLAQALSPATASEILAAKFLFYPAFGIILATLLSGIHNSAVLTRPFFWMALFVLSVGTLGIGMTVASLAKTQRAASLGALCYMLAVAMVLLICQQHNIITIPNLAIEYHAPHLLHATLTDQIHPAHWGNLAISGVLSTGWVFLAGILFRRRGWQ